MSNIFISYAQEDRPKAKLIAEELEQRGWSVWWDRMIPAGRVFDDVIEQEINDAKCIIVLWSSHSVHSRWVKSEASEGADRQILVPVLIEDVPIPLAFKRIQAADLTTWREGPLPSGFEKLVSDIDALPGLSRRGRDAQQQGVGGSTSSQDLTGYGDVGDKKRETPADIQDRLVSVLREEELPTVEKNHIPRELRNSRAKRPGGFWYGMATAVSVVTILVLGYWFYASQLLPQAPSPPEVVQPELGWPSPEQPASAPPEQMPSRAARPFEIALSKYRSNATTAGNVQLKATDVAENGAVVPAFLGSDILPGRHAWLISKNGCWYTELYNPAHTIITGYSLRIKMDRTDKLVALVEGDSSRVDEASKLVKVTVGSGIPCTGWTSAHSVGDMKKNLLDNAVRKAGQLHQKIKLEAKSDGGGFTLKSLIKHTATERDYIQYVGVYLNEKPVAYLTWGVLVTDNPYLSLTIRGAGRTGDDLKIGWIDNRGKVAVSQNTEIK
jgi:predicted secreted protein